MKKYFYVLLLIVAFTGCQQTPIVSSPEQSANKDAESYARDFNVSIQEATRRLNLQTKVGELNANLEEQEADTFGGLWIQHVPEFKIFAQFTKNDKNLITKYTNDPEVTSITEVRIVNKTLKELLAEQEKAMLKVGSLGISAEGGINLVENQVEVYVTSDSSNLLHNNLQAASIENTGAKIITVRQLASPAIDIYGGRSLSTCTAGFSVKTPAGTRGITTAGHCNNSQSFNGSALTFRQELYTGSVDLQWHTGTNLTYRNWAYDGLFDTSTPQYRIISGTKGRPYQTVSEYVCKYGRITGYGCGNILDVNYRFTNNAVPNSNATFVRVRNSSGVDLAEGGDSGGPWYVGSTAYGTMVAQAGVEAFYMPINYFNNLSLAVLTQ